MLSRKHILIATMFFTASIGLDITSIHGQVRQRQTRQPGFSTGQTISPYTQLFQPNRGGVNNYLFDVRPRLNTQRELSQLRQSEFQGVQQQQQLLAQQGQMFEQAIENTLQMTSRQGVGRIPSTAGRFLDTREFFGGQGARTGTTARSYTLRPASSAGRSSGRSGSTGRR